MDLWPSVRQYLRHVKYKKNYKNYAVATIQSTNN